MDWLDTETKALLQRSPPEKFAPPDAGTFALVLLADRGRDHRAIVGAVQRDAQASYRQSFQTKLSPERRQITCRISTQDSRRSTNFAW